MPIIAFHPQQTTYQTIKKPVQQLDILPTMLQIAGYDQEFFSLGKSLFEIENGKQSMILLQNQGTFYGLMDSLAVEFIEPDRFQFFEMKNDQLIPATFDSKTNQHLEQLLKANLQVFRSRMRVGKW